jgi:16S rRNA (cytosine967-C5)-methyltransferase
MTGAPTISTSPALSLLLNHTADAVQAVRDGQSLTQVLARCPAAVRPGVQALSFHTLRVLGSATELRQRLAPKAPAAKVDALLLTALALLWPQDDPGDRPAYAEHTLVDQAVNAARQRAPASANFINAVLRRFLREREVLVAAVRSKPQGLYNHPLWWITRIQNDWPQQWQGLLLAANTRPPMSLRVNRRIVSGQRYVQTLAEAGREASLLDDPAFGGQAVVLAAPCAVPLVPGFAQGHVSVQDAAAQRAALLLSAGLQPGARVLDACAAPGGKTAHLLELMDLDLLALDSDPARLLRVGDNLQRLQLRAELKAGDGRRPSDWWDGRPFDAILLDAPCTASGIVRRHPDVRWLRRPDDISTLSKHQSELLDALWPLLKPGGQLLYATCSLFLAEGQAQIDSFLQRQPPATAKLMPQSPGHLLPLPDNGAQPSNHRSAVLHDGFFYALIRKT